MEKSLTNYPRVLCMLQAASTYFCKLFLRGRNAGLVIEINLRTTYPRHDKFTANHLHISFDSRCDSQLMRVESNALYVC